MTWSKETRRFSEPNRELSEGQSRVRGLAVKVVGVTRTIFGTQAEAGFKGQKGGVIPLSYKRQALESFRDLANENYRRNQIR